MKNILQQSQYTFKIILIVFLNCLLQLSSISADANNISITNPSLNRQNTTDNYTFVQFDINWDNSWRTSSAPYNWDAVWVFVKYKVNGNYVSAAGATSSGTTITVGSTTGLRVGMPISKTAGSGTITVGTVVASITDATHFVASAAPSLVLSGGAVVTGTAIWEHATLNTSGHTAPSGSTIDTPTGGKGVFIYRASDGTGTNTWTMARLRWNYGTDNITANNKVDIQVYGIEMVYVPQGSFCAGDGATTNITGQLTIYNSSAAYHITSESLPATLGGSASGNMRNNNMIGMTTDDDFNNTTTKTLPTTFPKGYNAFYCMKYEISQQEYVDFLNNLTINQATARFPNQSTLRHGITVVSSIYSTSRPYLGCNWLLWPDLTAYFDWSGLRPMTELEFEKACRGTVSAVANEFAWGTIGIASSAYTLSNANNINETIASNYSTTLGNAFYSNTVGTIAGPGRVGVFSGVSGNTGRVTAGATYYGCMEMSGNLFERTVTLGNSTGRSFNGTHGDGKLNNNGDANCSTWPGTDAIGSGFKGGKYNGSSNLLRVSDRTDAATPWTTTTGHYGGRGIRTAP